MLRREMQKAADAAETDHQNAFESASQQAAPATNEGEGRSLSGDASTSRQGEFGRGFGEESAGERTSLLGAIANGTPAYAAQNDARTQTRTQTQTQTQTHNYKSIAGLQKFTTASDAREDANVKAGEDIDQDSDQNASFDGSSVGSSSSDSDSDGSLDAHAQRRPTTFLRCCGTVKRFFLLIADVDNLWDSPQVSGPQQRRHRIIVWFWFIALSTSYTSERSSFKVLVDWSGPYRLLAAQMVPFFHALLLAVQIIVSSIIRKESPFQPLGIPVMDVGLMALLDTVHILMVFLSGIHVPPTLTVILAQFVLPLSVFLEHYVYPVIPDVSDEEQMLMIQSETMASGTDAHGYDREQDDQQGSGAFAGVGGDSEYDDMWGNSNTAPQRQMPQQSQQPQFQHQSHRYVDETILLSHSSAPRLATEHVIGSVILCLAVLLALCPAIYSLADPEFFVYADAIPMRTSWNTILFVLSCIPAAASQLYKERTFLRHKQPVQPANLNFILSLLQFIFASLIAPMAFPLQGLGAGKGWETLYPAMEYSQNVAEGMDCFLRQTAHNVTTTIASAAVSAANDVAAASTDGGDDDGIDVNDELYKEEANCSFIILLVIWYALSVTSVGVAVDKLVNAGAVKLLYRGISAAVIVSVLCLYTYDMHTPDYKYGPAIDGLHLLCLILLVLGSEVYHRVRMPSGSFETVYPDVNVLYDDEE